MRLTHAPLVLDALIAEVASGERGGTSMFLGTVRGDAAAAGGVTAIAYSAYAAMAEAELGRIIEEVHRAHPGARVAVRHRLGRVPVGEASVAIVAAAPHRAEAFAACRAAIEHVKQRLPIWKKEERADGTTVWLDPHGRTVSAEQAPR